MASGDDAVDGLREALAVSPENLPLRKHLAQTLLNLNRPAEAEKEYRAASRLASDDPELKLGLARSFERQGKRSEALVVLETITHGDDALPAARLLLARLLQAGGNEDDAARHYRRAVEADPKLADDDLAETLGESHKFDEDDIPFGDYDEDGEEYERDMVGDYGPALDGEELEKHLGAEKPQIDFKHVGGLEEVKEQVRLKIIHPIEHPDLYKAYGKGAGGGILLYGPPGCGKTLLARATAGEIGRRFLSVGISDVMDMWIGSSERNLHALFEQARRRQPCILFFDEVDALAASRSDMRTSSGRHLINQFLSELDGVEADNNGVLILAATNAPWHVDSAFRRPGRFDRVLFVPPPDEEARLAILQALLRDKPAEGVDYRKLAAKTPEFSGADLKAVVDVAVEAKLTEALKAGTPQPLTTKDLLAATKQVRPSTREWFSTARNHALYANQGGQYDEIVKYLNL